MPRWDPNLVAEAGPINFWISVWNMKSIQTTRELCSGGLASFPQRLGCSWLGDLVQGSGMWRWSKDCFQCRLQLMVVPRSAAARRRFWLSGRAGVTNKLMYHSRKRRKVGHASSSWIFWIFARESDVSRNNHKSNKSACEETLEP